MSASDKVKNETQDLKGKAEEAVGHVTNDQDKVVEGKANQSAADVKKAGENVKDAFKR
ncbi:CsbD family protein [Diaminobutyricibacter sp. McL0618]|uniref:CsbD family protein n=1 Tax=Leifsonia sp. McL0618 TaxID=3415677 RepID=UPI003CED3F1C